jgi:hypothetical protein
MQIKPALCLLGLAVVATAAIAGNPKFLRAPSASLGSPKVIVSWIEVGLSNNEGVTYEASAKAAATYQCVNVGNNCPSASNKEDLISEVSVMGTFKAKNGRISGSLDVPAPPPTLKCPGNQVVNVVSVVFTEIRLTDMTNGVSSLTNPDSLSYNGFECP